MQAKHTHDNLVRQVATFYICPYHTLAILQLPLVLTSPSSSRIMLVYCSLTINISIVASSVVVWASVQVRNMISYN